MDSKTLVACLSMAACCELLCRSYMAAYFGNCAHTAASAAAAASTIRGSHQWPIVCRLHAGSLNTLILLEFVGVKVWPRLPNGHCRSPPVEVTLRSLINLFDCVLSAWTGWLAGCFLARLLSITKHSYTLRLEREAFKLIVNSDSKSNPSPAANVGVYGKERQQLEYVEYS